MLGGLVKKAKCRFKHPTALGVSHEMGLVYQEERIVLNYPLGFRSQVSSQLLRCHDQNRRARSRQGDPNGPGVLRALRKYGKASVKVALKLSSKTVGRHNDASGSGTTSHMRNDDELRHERLAGASGKGHDESFEFLAQGIRRRP